MSQPKLDRDTREVVALLRAALEESGLSQAAFARSLGTSGSRMSTYLAGTTRPSAQLLVRAVRIGRGLAAAREAGLMSPPATAEAVRAELRACRTSWAWRMLLQGRDHLVETLERQDEHLLDAWDARPGDVGGPGWSTLLAALAAHEFHRFGCAAPEWTDVKPLDEPWMPDHPFLSPERLREQTPPWLSDLNVWVPARDVTTA